MPTVGWVRLAVAPVLVFIATSVDRGYQTDFWQHLARGRAIVEQRAIVSNDLVTFTVPGRAYFDNNWLTQILYFRLYGFGGINLIQFVNSLTLAIAVALLVALCRKASGSTRAAAAAGVMVFLGLWQTMTIRPQTFSVLLFVMLYAVLTRAAADRSKRRLLALTPLMMALWANVHGGFAIGLVLIACFAMASMLEAIAGAWSARGGDESEPMAGVTATGWRAVAAATWPWVACLAVSALATLANPYGWRVYAYAGTLSRIGIDRGIEEWLPPGTGLWIGKAWIASIVLLVGLLVASRRRPRLREVCLIACFLPFSIASTRMVVWWMLAIAPVLARLMSEIATRARPGSSLTNETSPAPPSFGAATAFASMLLAAVFCLPWLERFNPAFSRVRSAHRTDSDLQAASAELSVMPSARVFTRLEWGNYLSWSLAPRGRIFIDGRIELYPDELWVKYLTVSAGRPGWQAVLDDYKVDALVLDRTYHPTLLARARASGKWDERLASGDAVLLCRRRAIGSADAGAGKAAPVASAGDF